MMNKKKLSLEEINSDALIQRLKANDDLAFSDLFNSIVPKLCWFFSHNFQLSDTDGEEIAADVMVKINKSIGKFDPQGGAKLSTWIFRIAQNTAIDYLRQKKAQSEYFSLDISLDETVSKQVERKEAKQWFRETHTHNQSRNTGNVSPQISNIKNALDALNEQDRRLLLMKQSMEYEEIAEVESVSVPTLRTRYSRALQRLREELQKEENL